MKGSNHVPETIDGLRYLGTQLGEDRSISHVAKRFMGTGRGPEEPEAAAPDPVMTPGAANPTPGARPPTPTPPVPGFMKAARTPPLSMAAAIIASPGSRLELCPACLCLPQSGNLLAVSRSLSNPLDEGSSRTRTHTYTLIIFADTQRRSFIQEKKCERRFLTWPLGGATHVHSAVIRPCVPKPGLVATLLVHPLKLTPS